MIKTNLRWPGGKSRMVKKLEVHFPKKIDNYFDLFLGGGSVLLHVIQKYMPIEIMGNDIDKDLINYYCKVQKKPDEIINTILDIKNNFDSDQFRKKFNDLDRKIPEHYFILNKTSFSGIGYNYSKSSYEKNFTIKSINRINEISEIIKNVRFSNVDFEEIKFPLKNFFIYLDPPYFSNRKKGLYGKNGEYHKEFNHKSLRELVERYRNDNEILLSYDDCDEIRELYKDFNIIPFDFTYSMTNTGGNMCKIGKELIIKNY